MFAGKTWTSVSELGSADFHVIEPAGDQLVGALFQQSQVLVSGDEGKTWETRAAPLPLVALAVNPQDPQLWIGSSERGIYASTDGGETWRQRDPTPGSFRRAVRSRWRPSPAAWGDVPRACWMADLTPLGGTTLP